MTVKCLAAGNLFGYLMSPRNYKGEQRTLEPRWLADGPLAAMNFLERTSPPHVKKDKKRRWVGHCRRNMTHLIVGFKEGHRDVDDLLRCAVRATECLILAGLPRTSLEFAWCYHAQNENSHLHCAVMRSLLPGGGTYAAKLPYRLAVDFSWLVTWRLNLELPIGRTNARLVHGGEFSYKHENRGCIKNICEMTRELFQRDSQGNPRLSTHQHFLDLLEQRRAELGIGEILVAPNKEGQPMRRTPYPIGRIYPRSVAVQGPKTIIWLQGPVCRPDFNLTDWENKLDKQQGLFANPDMVFDRFQRRLQARIIDQRARYRIPAADTELVAQRHFEWLNPHGFLSSAPIQAIGSNLLGLDMPLPHFVFEELTKSQPLVNDFAEYGPDSAYPFYSDPNNLEQSDITGLPDGFDEFPEEDLDEGCFWPFPAWERLIVLDSRPRGPSATRRREPIQSREKPAPRMRYRLAPPEEDEQPDQASGLPVDRATGVPDNLPTGVPANPAPRLPADPVAGPRASGSLSQSEEIEKAKSTPENSKPSQSEPQLAPKEKARQAELREKKRLRRSKLQREISGEMAWECEVVRPQMTPDTMKLDLGAQTNEKPKPHTRSDRDDDIG